MPDERPLPDYEALCADIARVPNTWIPGLLIAVVAAAVEKRVFIPGKVATFVENVETKAREKANAAGG